MFERKLVCSHCLFDEDSKKQVLESGIPYKFLVHSTDGFHEFTCPYGHKNQVFLQAENFEIQLAIGIESFATADYDSTALRFFSALERIEEFLVGFLEFADGVTIQQLSEIKSRIGAQSERRHGWYLGITEKARITGQPLDFLMEKRKREEIAKLRNDVAHNGTIPTKDEVTPFCRDILGFIYSACNYVLTREKDFPVLLFSSKISSRRSKLDSSPVTMSFGGPLSHDYVRPPPSFEELVMQAVASRQYLHDSSTGGPFIQFSSSGNF